MVLVTGSEMRYTAVYLSVPCLCAYVLMHTLANNTSSVMSCTSWRGLVVTHCSCLSYPWAEAVTGTWCIDSWNHWELHGFKALLFPFCFTEQLKKTKKSKTKHFEWKIDCKHGRGLHDFTHRFLKSYGGAQCVGSSHCHLMSPISWLMVEHRVSGQSLSTTAQQARLFVQHEKLSIRHQQHKHGWEVKFSDLP